MTQTLSGPVDFHSLNKNDCRGQWDPKLFGNLFFCVPRKKEMHTGLE